MRRKGISVRPSSDNSLPLFLVLPKSSTPPVSRSLLFRCKMHRCPVTAAAVLCSAMLLLPLLAGSTTDATNTTSSCAPAACGNLAITYPFWLSGTHPPECGYRAFQVTCKLGITSLGNAFWTYRVLDIFYQNSSFRVANVDLLDGTCDAESYFNASSDLGLAPFRISPRNQELFFLYNCTRMLQLPRAWAPVRCAKDSFNSFACLSSSYKPDDNWGPLPGNCSVSMVLPVGGYKGAAAEEYERLMKGGFLLEYTAEDCTACKESGGLCRTNVSDDALECHCSDAVYPVVCGELAYPFFSFCFAFTL